MADRHILYGVVGPVRRKVRLSEPLSYPVAVDAHEALHRNFSTGEYNRRVMSPGYTVHGLSVDHFAVRSADDPNWPADGLNFHPLLKSA